MVPKTKAPVRPKAYQPPTMHAPVPPDPFGSPGSYINASVNRLGTPLSDAEIQSQAQGMLSPLVQQITGELGRQAQAGTAAIGGYTSNLAKALSGYRQSAADIYGSAQQSQAASDAALSSRLQGGGEQMAADLSGKLASINAPNAVGQAAAGITQTGTGSGNALYANGSAALADLIARGAAEQSYAAKLPGLAGLAGEQQLGGLQGNLQSSLADQLAQVQTQVPGIVNSLQGQRSDLLNRQESLRATLEGQASDKDAKTKALKAEAIMFGGFDPKTGRLTPAARKALSKLYGTDIGTGAPKGVTTKTVQPTKLTIVHNDDGSTVAVDPTTGSIVTQISGPGAKSKKPTKPVTFQGTDGRTYTVNPKTGVAKPVPGQSPGKPLVNPADKQKVAKQKAAEKQKAKLHGLTQGQYQSHAAEALGAARHYHAPKDKGGASWQQYLTAGQQQGIPTWILIEQGRKVYTPRERKLNTYAGEG